MALRPQVNAIRYQQDVGSNRAWFDHLGTIADEHTLVDITLTNGAPLRGFVTEKPNNGTVLFTRLNGWKTRFGSGSLKWPRSGGSSWTQPTLIR